jgi:transcriptional regulator GlxA family with amidase domain
MTVGILIFDAVEVLDFAGPFEVLSRARTVPGVASRLSDDAAPFDVFTVARTTAPVMAIGGLRVSPAHSFTSAPHIDLLIVPGGFGTRALLNDPVTLEWVRGRASEATITASVCTGALVLATLGLLANRRATTHYGAFDLLAAIDASIIVARDVRFVDDGVITSAGVSAGLDMALHIVDRQCGRAVADETAAYIEYRRN